MSVRDQKSESAIEDVLKAHAVEFFLKQKIALAGEQVTTVGEI